MRLFLASNLTLRTLESTELDGLFVPRQRTRKMLERTVRTGGLLRFHQPRGFSNFVDRLILGGALGSNVRAQDAAA